ncbi:trimethylguanosine synthase [Bombyx mori]|uniref:Trimethylguanosine synthase n=1 Tax=Bombyx mori TaxID=7091 RepID=A0A8R2QVF8_BOMMO|nr:trimethylguanosine synthase [Bombyx mori]
MMSEYYDHYHRWEPLAEFHFSINSDDEYDEDNYLYCLCSRAFIRDSVKTYYIEKEDASESETEILDSQDGEDHSHVHFSVDTSYKVKCEKDEGASCYCSASHTENYCSTDEHDPTQIHGISNALQPSDSGADLTYQDYHSDYISHDKLEQLDHDTEALIENENYLSEDTWEKFWAIHGERLIWASWIKKYSNYINPAFLNENNDLTMDENGVPTQHSEDIYKENIENTPGADDIRERKFSYDSKVNPYKKNSAIEKVTEKTPSVKDDQWLPIARRRSCSEHDRILSPRTVTGTDSMTNVTKITLSSYDIGSSHVTSESTPTDDYSMSSSSEDQSNDQTRIATVYDSLDNVPITEMDTEQYWQFLWKQHFGEQFAAHYANYINKHGEQNNDDPPINLTSMDKGKVEKSLDIECENSEGNSQEMPTVIEVQTKVEQMKLDDKPKIKKRNKKKSFRYLDSVGVLLQNLIKDEEIKLENETTVEVIEAGDENEKKSVPAQSDSGEGIHINSYQQSDSNTSFKSYSYDDGDDDPPEENPIKLKRSHEYDDEETASETIKSTFEIMGFCLNAEKLLTGHMVYRKRLARLRPPRNKKYGTGKKTYFDDDGNALNLDEYEKQMQHVEECTQTISDTERKSEHDPSEVIERKDEKDKGYIEGSELGSHLESRVFERIMKVQDSCDATEIPQDSEEQVDDSSVTQQETSKRKRRQKRYSRVEEDASEMPQELQDDPKMFKYWKKRHSLFHRFDEGIKLDRESWFSVTPENVARHIAAKCPYDTVVDAFCGAGGNTIQFAKTSKKVIAIDIDPLKIEMAKHNAQVYGVSDRIQFIVGDFFELAPQLAADMVFLSPPWGGPSYSSSREYDLEMMLEPKPASELMRVARSVSTCVVLYLPRNSRPDQIISLARNMSGSLEVEQNYLDRRFVAITAYYY